MNLPARRVVQIRWTDGLGMKEISTKKCWIRRKCQLDCHMKSISACCSPLDTPATQHEKNSSIFQQQPRYFQNTFCRVKFRHASSNCCKRSRLAQAVHP